VGIVGSTSLSAALVACAVLIALHWLGSWLACRSHRVGDLIKGHTRLLAESGQTDWTQMRKSHVSLHDLKEVMWRRANIGEFARVKAAERSAAGKSASSRAAAPTAATDDHLDGR
jgi:uncharacterized membrane protein YcaP (DUF421 family)